MSNLFRCRSCAYKACTKQQLGGIKMSGLIKRIRTWFTSFLSVETLLHEQKLLLFAILFYFCATGVSGVFVNLFLYQTTVNTAGLAATNALANVIVFNLFTYIFLLVMSGLLGVFGKRISEKGGMLAGLGIYMLLFVFVLLADTNVSKYLIWLAFFNAAGSATFHLSYNQILGYSFSERTKRLFLTMLSFFVTAAGILTPIIAGIFVQNGKSMNGYTVAFGTALIMLAVSAGFVLCLRLPRKRIVKRTYFAGVLVNVFREKNLLLVHLAELLRGMREGALAFLFPVLIYTISENAIAVGFYVAICSLLQVLGEHHVLRTSNEENRLGLMLFAVAVMLVATVVFSFGFSVMTVYAYGIITALVGGFLYVPIAGLFHWSTGKITNASKKSVEIQLVRELVLSFGKVLGALVVLLCYRFNVLLVAVIVLNLVLILSWVLFSRVGEDVPEASVSVEGSIERENENDAD